MPDLEELEIVASTEGGVTIISPRGELDMATSPAFREAIVTAFAGARYVVADLADLAFLDSSGLAVLAVAHKRAAECGARFEIANPREQARNLMELTGVDNVVPVRDGDRAAPPAQP
jgi:anti-sigma B factor antagonist